METVKVLSKILSVLMFFAAATLFLYGCTTMGLARYTAVPEGVDINSASHLLRTIYLPVIYTILSLAVMLILQLTVISQRSPNTKRLFALGLIVFFAIVLGGTIIMLAYGLVRIPNNLVNNDPAIWVVSLCPLFGLSIIEIVVGSLSYYRNNKILKAEEEKEDDEPGRPA